MLRLQEYQEPSGRSPFARWFKSLDAVAAAKVAVAMARLAAGNTSSLKGVGSGVLESRIDFGPGYRVYLARDGDTLVILLGGGTKKRQSGDIANAIVRWVDYKARKRGAAWPEGKLGGRSRN